MQVEIKSWFHRISIILIYSPIETIVYQIHRKLQACVASFFKRDFKNNF